MLWYLCVEKRCIWVAFFSVSVCMLLTLMSNVDISFGIFCLIRFGMLINTDIFNYAIRIIHTHISFPARIHIPTNHCATKFLALSPKQMYSVGEMYVCVCVGESCVFFPLMYACMRVFKKSDVHSYGIW